MFRNITQYFLNVLQCASQENIIGSCSVVGNFYLRVFERFQPCDYSETFKIRSILRDTLTLGPSSHQEHCHLAYTYCTDLSNYYTVSDKSGFQKLILN